MLCLVRHGAAAGDDSADPPLSDAGRSQAELLSARLHGRTFTRLLHSPLRRARETAAIVGSFLSVPPEESSLLTDLTPVPSPDRRSDYPKRFWPWFEDVPSNEQDLNGERLTAAFDELSRLSAAGPILAVSHAFVIGWFVRLALTAPTSEWLRLQPANCGLTTLAPDRSGRLMLAGFNDIGHLDTD